MLLFVKTLRASMTLWRHNDVQKFDAHTILFTEVLCKKRDILMFKRRYQCGLGWNQVKYARITITHLLGSSDDVLNTWPNGLMLKQCPLDPAIVNA